MLLCCAIVAGEKDFDFSRSGSTFYFISCVLLRRPITTCPMDQKPGQQPFHHHKKRAPNEGMPNLGSEGDGCSLKSSAPTVPVEVLDTVLEVGAAGRSLVLYFPAVVRKSKIFCTRYGTIYEQSTIHNCCSTRVYCSILHNTIRYDRMVLYLRLFFVLQRTLLRTCTSCNLVYMMCIITSVLYNVLCNLIPNTERAGALWVDSS